MRFHTTILTTVLGLSLASTTAAAPLVDVKALTAGCRALGDFGAHITERRNSGISRAMMGQRLLESMHHLKRDNPALYSNVWLLFTSIYNDLGHQLTPTVIRTTVADACIQAQLNALAK